MAKNVGNEFNIVLNATIDNNALQKELNDVRERLLKNEVVKLNVEIDADATKESLSILNDAVKEFKTNLNERLTLNVDDSKMKSVETSLKNQNATLNELNKALLERNRIELEIQKIENSKSYNTSAQRASISAQEQLLSVEKQRIETLQQAAAQQGISEKATLAQEKADLQLEAAQQRVISSSKQNIGFLQNMTSGLKEATARIFDYTIAYRAIAGVGQIFRESIDSAKELDGVLVDLQIVTGGTRDEAEKLLLTYNEMAQQLGSTTQAVAESANEFLRQGLSVTETNDMIEASQYLSKLGMIDSAEATQYITSATKGYGLAASEAMSVVDKLTKVDINAAVSSGYLAEAMARTANSAQQAGVDMDTLIGYIATIGETTQRSASTVGESLKTMFARFGNVKAGVFASGESDMENLNDIEKVFGKLGIAIRDSASEMRDVDDILGELAEKWSTLNDVEKNAVATAAAGVRQRENFLVLMNNYNTALGLEEESLNSAGTAAQKYEAYNGGLEASLNRIQTAFEGIILQIQESNALKMFAGAGADILEFLEKTNLLKAGLISLFAIMATKGIIKLSSSIKTAAADFSRYATILNNVKKAETENVAVLLSKEVALQKLNAKQLENILTQQNVINGIKQEAAAREVDSSVITDAILKNTSLTAAEKTELRAKLDSATGSKIASAALTTQASTTSLATGATNGFTASLKAMGVALLTNPITWIIGAITALIQVFTWMSDEVNNVKSEFDELKSKLDETKSTLESLSSEYENVGNQIDELASKESRTAKEEETLEQLRLQSEELEKQIEYQEQLEEVRNREAANKAVDWYYEKYRSPGAIVNGTAGLDMEMQDTFQEAIRLSEILNENQERYNQLKEEEALGNVSNQEELDWLREVETQLGDNVIALQGFYDELGTVAEGLTKIENPLTEQDRQANDLINSYRQLSNGLTRILNPDNYKKLNIANLIQTEGLEDKLAAVVDNVKQNLSGKQIVVDSEVDEYYKELEEAAQEAGISVEELTDYINEQAQASYDAEIAIAEQAYATQEFHDTLENLSNMSDPMSEYADSISSITEKIDLLNVAQQELAEYGGIAADTLKSLSDNDLLGYLLQLEDGTYNAADAQLAMEWAAKQSAIASILDAGNKQIETIATADLGGQLDTLTPSLIAAGDNSATLGTKVAATISPTVTAAGAMNAYWEAARGENPNLEGLSAEANAMIDKVKNNMQGLIDNVLSDIRNITLKKIDRSSGGSSKKKSSGSGSKKSSGSKSGSGSSSSKTDNTDYWKQAFDAEYATLKHNRDMDIISEKEYLEQLDALNQKYFAGRAKYLDEYRKYEEEVYKGRKKELEEQQKAEIEAAKEVYEAQKDAIKKQQDNLKDQLDAYKKIIDKRKELLSTMKEEKSYQDELTDKNNSILDLENRIAELRYDTSAEGTKKRLELEDELAKKVKEKEDYMYDHSVTAQQDALDKEYDNYAEFIDDAISKLDESLDRLEQAFEATTKAIEAQFKALIDALNDNAVDGGVGAGGGGFGFGIQNLSGQRGDAVKQAQQQLNDQYGGGLNVDGIWGSKTQAAYVRAVQKYLNDNFGAGLAVDGIWGSKTQAAWESAGGGAKPFHKGIEEGFVGGVEGNEMFAKLLNGELVTNEGQQNRFMDKILPQLLGNTAQAVTETISNGVNIDMDFNVAGNMDESVIPQVRNAVKEIIETYFIRGQKRNVRAFSI